MLKLGKFLLLAALLTVSSAGAQTTPATSGTPDSSTPGFTVTTSVSQSGAPQQVMLWSGISAEALLLPGLSLGLSAPVGQVSGMNLELRGTVGAHIIMLPYDAAPGSSGGIPVPISGNLDLLLSSGNSAGNWYFGPSVGTLSGAVWMFGGVIGGRNSFGNSNWGYYGEIKGRAGVISGSSDLFFMPTLNFGLTYRF